MQKVLGRLLAGLSAVCLLCGFTAFDAGQPRNEFVRKQWKTAESVNAVLIQENYPDVVLQPAADAQTTELTVDYADANGEELYSFSLENGVLTIQKENEPTRKALTGIQLGSRMCLYRRVVEIPDNGVDTTLVVTLPQKEYESVQVAARSGSVTVQGLAAQTVAVKSTYGAVRVENCTAQSMDVQTKLKDITFLNNTAQSVHAKADNSTITLTGNNIQTRTAESGGANS